MVVVCGHPSVALAQIAGLTLRGLQPGGARSGDALPDAFRSAFDDRDGWWSLARPLTDPELRVDYTNDEPVTRRLTGGEGFAHDRRLESALAGPLGRLPGRWWGELNYESIDLQTAGDATNSGTLLYGRGQALSGALRFFQPGPGLTLQFSAPLWHDGPMDRRVLGAGVRLQPADVLHLQVARTRTLSDLEFEGQVLEEPIPFDLNFAEDAWHVDIRLAPWRWLSLEGNWREAEYEPQDEPGPGRQYEFTPGGRDRIRAAGFHLTPWRDHTFLLRYQELELDLDAGIHWGGQQFGWLTYGMGFQHSRLAAGRWHPSPSTRWQIELEAVDLDVKGRAKIESWPFTDTVIDLLGVRQIFWGHAEVKWRRLTALRDFEALGGRWRVGTSWFRIHPEAVAETWRPAVLVFGQADFREYELTVTRLDLVSLLLETTVPAGPVDLSLSVQQFVYGSSVESARDPDESDPPDDPPEERATDGWWGGTYLKMGLVFGFD